MRFTGLRAAVWAGATLGELDKWIKGEEPFTNEFKAQIVALYNMDNLITAHVEDEKAKAAEKQR